MELIFTKHALDRMEGRDIHFYEIMNCLYYPDVIKDDNGKAIYIKLDDTEISLLMVSCVFEEQNCIILTVIRTDKILKYI